MRKNGLKPIGLLYQIAKDKNLRLIRVDSIIIKAIAGNIKGTYFINNLKEGRSVNCFVIELK